MRVSQLTSTHILKSLLGRARHPTCFNQGSLFILSLLAFAAGPCAQAQAQLCSTGSPPCVYSVKFICGNQSANPKLHAPSEPPVKPGNYATAINIHNYHLDQSAVIEKTAVIANPEDAPSLGQITPRPRIISLPPGRAFEIDCSDIVTLFGTTTPLPPFIKGFVELRAPPTGGNLPLLSVTAVYTAQQAIAGTAPSGPISIEVVPVQPLAGP
jgi:hypothetical protein